jgi:preprotein translocase subunit YajC
MWISQAFAQDAAATEGFAGLGGIGGLLPLVLIFVVFWFLLIRPQQKKMKQHRAMVSALKRGDKVVTSGGIYGEIVKVQSDTEVQVEIAEGVRVRMQRGAIAEVVTRSQPANDEGEKKAG